MAQLQEKVKNDLSSQKETSDQLIDKLTNTLEDQAQRIMNMETSIASEKQGASIK